MKYIKFFDHITLADLPLVGGKNASLGHLISSAKQFAIKVPYGFAITTTLYHDYCTHNNITEPLKKLLTSLNTHHTLADIQKVGNEAHTLFEAGSFTDQMKDEIKQAYTQLSQWYNSDTLAVAVRSSATSEDTSTTSSAGQCDSFLNIVGYDSLLAHIKRAMASLFNSRALAYRLEKGIHEYPVAISIGVQKMVRADRGAAGVAFSLDTESGFDKVITINGSWGLGEAIVQGIVVPDEFIVFKPTLNTAPSSIIAKTCGTKKTKVVYDTPSGTKKIDIPLAEQQRFCLTDAEILLLARQIAQIEQDYSARAHSWIPIDVEWAKDGIDGQLYIVQVRTETVHSLTKKEPFLTVYRLVNPPVTPLFAGQSVGQSAAQGRVRIIPAMSQSVEFNKGDILVTRMTNPDWTPLMKKAAAIITQEGGRTCHAAIVSRELGIPAIVGCPGALTTLHEGQTITVDCSQGQTGFVYDGRCTIEQIKLPLLSHRPKSTKLMLNIADPSQAFTLSFLPVDGVGLARTEFIIANMIGIHPLAAVQPEAITDPTITQTIKEKTAAYATPAQYFTEQLACGIGTIAAAFYPRPILVRLSDFKSNEYNRLIGGAFFEKEEENPMLGFRGASRYCSTQYQAAFALECAAIKQVRFRMGLDNVGILVPFVRTLQEASKTLELLQKNGLERGDTGLTIHMMCEVPSNVVLIHDFSLLFDGFSIGSNDLTQLTLGIDRSCAVLAHEFDEQDPAMKALYRVAIDGAHFAGKPIGSCGQGPADYPKLAEFLIQAGIDSLSFDREGIIHYLTSEYEPKQRELRNARTLL